MCYELDREYRLRRAEEIREQMRKNDERLKEHPAAPAKPDSPSKDVEGEVVPA
jgi:hypothetical protein